MTTSSDTARKVNPWPPTTTTTLQDHRRFTLANGLSCACGSPIRNDPELLEDDAVRLTCAACHRDVLLITG
jgi:hypothetical protein